MIEDSKILLNCSSGHLSYKVFFIQEEGGLF
jgi:hypothetical protein